MGVTVIPPVSVARPLPFDFSNVLVVLMPVPKSVLVKTLSSPLPVFNTSNLISAPVPFSIAVVVLDVAPSLTNLAASSACLLCCAAVACCSAILFLSNSALALSSAILFASAALAADAL